MKQFWKKVGIGLLGALLCLVLITPVVVYINVFGDKISNDHNLWGAMGSAMSGIYGPILTILTLSLLILQIRIQQKTNKYMFDQWFLQDTKSDVEFYLVRLAEVLNTPVQGRQTIRDVLHNSFQHATVQQLEASHLEQVARDLHKEVPNLSDIWGAIYGVTAALEWFDDSAYKREFTSAKLKTEAMLSKVSCIALDNYLFCRAPEEYRSYKFQFSHGLARR